MGIPTIGGGNGVSRLRGDREIHHKEAEHVRTVYCDATDSGPLRAVRSEARGEGVLAVVGTGRPRLGGGEEKGGRGSGGFRRRGVDRRGGGNAPGMTTGHD